MRPDGGALVPDAFVRELARVQQSDNLLRTLFPPPAPVKLTRRLRFRIWRDSVRWAVHDRLFPECDRDDRY